MTTQLRLDHTKLSLNRIVILRGDWLWLSRPSCAMFPRCVGHIPDALH